MVNKRHNECKPPRCENAIVENGETLINCFAYIGLNPPQAGLIENDNETKN